MKIDFWAIVTVVTMILGMAIGVFVAMKYLRI